MIRLTQRARDALRADEVVLVDWHVAGTCCAELGEFSFRAIRRDRVPAEMRPAGPDSTSRVVVHPTAWSHLTDLDVSVDCRRFGRLRWFSSDLPADAGLRACMGDLEHSHARGMAAE